MHLFQEVQKLVSTISAGPMLLTFVTTRIHGAVIEFGAEPVPEIRTRLSSAEVGVFSIV